MCFQNFLQVLSTRVHYCILYTVQFSKYLDDFNVFLHHYNYLGIVSFD